MRHRDLLIYIFWNFAWVFVIIISFPIAKLESTLFYTTMKQEHSRNGPVQPLPETTRETMLLSSSKPLKRPTLKRKCSESFIDERPLQVEQTGQVDGNGENHHQRQEHVTVSFPESWLKPREDLHPSTQGTAHRVQVQRQDANLPKGDFHLPPSISDLFAKRRDPNYLRFMEIASELTKGAIRSQNEFAREQPGMVSVKYCTNSISIGPARPSIRSENGKSTVTCLTKGFPSQCFLWITVNPDYVKRPSPDSKPIVVQMKLCTRVDVLCSRTQKWHECVPIDPKSPELEAIPIHFSDSHGRRVLLKHFEDRYDFARLASPGESLVLRFRIELWKGKASIVSSCATQPFDYIVSKTCLSEDYPTATIVPRSHPESVSNLPGIDAYTLERLYASNLSSMRKLYSCSQTLGIPRIVCIIFHNGLSLPISKEQIETVEKWLTFAKDQISSCCDSHFTNPIPPNILTDPVSKSFCTTLQFSAKCANLSRQLDSTWLLDKPPAPKLPTLSSVLRTPDRTLPDYYSPKRSMYAETRILREEPVRVVKPEPTNDDSTHSDADGNAPLDGQSSETPRRNTKRARVESREDQQVVPGSDEAIVATMLLSLRQEQLVG